MPSHVPPQTGDDVCLRFGDAGSVTGRVVAVETLPAEAGFSYDVIVHTDVAENIHTVLRGINHAFVQPCKPYIDHY